MLVRYREEQISKHCQLFDLDDAMGVIWTPRERPVYVYLDCSVHGHATRHLLVQSQQWKHFSYVILVSLMLT